MSDPLVTIFTPVYNHEKYLDEYFESIICQTYKNIELILIDDASPDLSRKIIEKWLIRLEERFENIIYIPRQENKGLIYNCNESLELAKGKYICGFASDDVMMPTNIEEKVCFLENNTSYPMVYSDAYSGINLTDSNKRVSEEQSHFEGSILEKMVCNGNFIPAPAVLLKREVVIEVGGYSDEYMFEDYPMWIKIAAKYNIGYIPKALVFYRVSPNSLSHSDESFEDMINSQVNLLKDIHLKYNINTDEALDRLYKNATFFYKSNKVKSRFYVSLIKKKSILITLWKFLILLPLSPVIINYALKFIKKIS